MQVSATTLSTWTGIHRDTIRKRLSSIMTGQRGELVDSVQALPLLYGATGERLDPVQEKARLDRTRREAAEIDLELKRRSVIALSEVFDVIDIAGTAFREHMMGLPGRFASLFAAETDARVIEREMEAEIRTALEHISNSKDRFEVK